MDQESQLRMEARSGNAEACLQIATLYHQQKRYSRRDDFLSRAIKAGLPKAKFHYCKWQLENIHGPWDWFKLNEYLSQSWHETRLESALLHVKVLLASGESEKALEKLLPFHGQSATVDFFIQSLKSTESTTALPKLLHSQGSVQLIEGFASDKECNWLRKIAQPYMRPAMIIDPQTGIPRLDPYRISKMASISPALIDPIIHALDRRIAHATSSKWFEGEPFSIMNYQTGGQYKPHFDAFPPGHPETRPENGGQRTKTAILYLNDSCKGGSTDFPRLQISVQPKRGSLLIFDNTCPEGTLLEQSLHNGTEVTSGEKWIATKWIRSQRSRYGKGLPN